MIVKIYRIGFLALLSFGLLFFFAKQNKLEPAPTPYNSLHEKWLPNQHHFFQRASANGRMELNAYETALQQARLKQKNRNASPGFDENWTTQGPGNSGSRANVIAINPLNENIIYIGYSSSGVFKTIDGGQNWFPIFDDQNFLGIGAITLDPINPNIVYVGTGDPNITSYPFIGDGLYKSTDGGQNWTHLGLTDQRIISKVLIDPTNTDHIFVATMGLPFERNNERGLYKSTDGGLTWNQVLFLTNQTGIIDILLNPSNPQVVYAAGWDRISNTMENIGTGTGAKIYKSSNGGDTWTNLSNGLPTGSQSRIGLAMSNSDPNLIYALYIGTDFQIEGIYKTTDAGLNWTALPQTGLHSNAMGGQGWYFGEIRVHPNDHDKIYLLGLQVYNTLDGGQNWFNLTSSTGSNPVHVDMHEMVFSNSGVNVFLGTDGGVYKSSNGGGSFQKVENIPATQMYRVAYDPHRLDKYYGGSQDNGSVVGNETGIDNWNRLIGADGFQPAFNPLDSNIFYLETQFGGIKVTTDAGQSFFSATGGIGGTDRRNWDLPYLINTKNPNILYAGTHRVYRSNTISGIPSWQAISGDLCDQNYTNNGGFHTISCLSNSVVDSAIVFVGTSDGNIWKTLDEGNNWTNINGSLPDRYVTSVKASPDVDNEVYVSFSGYDDNIFTPLVYKSTDAGSNWMNISGDLPQLAINDLFILPNNFGNVIFAATDGGVYATLDAGQSWERLGSDMPFVPVFDLDWHEAYNQLIAGTHGRSIMTFPLDSIDVSAAPLIADFAGNIRTPDGDNLDSMLVNIEDGFLAEDSTDQNGDYLFEQVLYGSGCKIMPYKNTDPRNGVNLFDLVLMQKHILNLEILDSPYKLIAGDQDRNGQVSILDIIEYRKLLLFLSTELPDNPSWRFIPTDHVFLNLMNPYATPLPEYYDCEDLNGDNSNLDFMAIKMGDVDYDADASSLQLSEVRNIEEPFVFVVEDAMRKRGELIQLNFESAQVEKLLGFQFTLQFDPQKLKFKNIDASKLKQFNSNHINLEMQESGFLTFCWNVIEELEIQAEDLIFSLSFEAKEDLLLSECLTINDRYTKRNALRFQSTSSLEFAEILLAFDKANSTTSIENFNIQLAPNPFVEKTTLSYELEDPSWIQWEILNVEGKRISQSPKAWKSAGRHAITINENQISNPGIYYCILRINKKKQVLKFMKL